MKTLLIILLSAALGVVGCLYMVKQNAGSEASASAESTYARVMRTGTIRCGYTPYSVGLIKDPNTGTMSGIYYEIVMRLAQDLGLKVDWVEEVGWSGQIEGLNTKRYDMVCSPVSLTSSRARAADISIPLYYSPVYIWAKKDNTTITEDTKALDNPNTRISTLDGEQTSVFAKQFFPQAQQVSLPQTTPFSDLLLQVTTGKADIAFSEPFSVYEFMKNNPDTLRMVTPLNQPMLLVPNILLLPRGEYEFREMINNELHNMFNSRLIDGFIDKYEIYPHSYIRETGWR